MEQPDTGLPQDLQPDSLGVTASDVDRMTAALAKSGDPLFAEPEAPAAAPEAKAATPEASAEQPKDGQAPDELTADDLPDGDGVNAQPAVEDAFKIVHNGQEHTLTRADTIKYAQQGFDYTQKTQALAELHKQTAERLQRATEIEQVQQAATQELAHLAALEAQLAPYQNVDWVAYATSNPQDYPIQRARFDELQRAYSGLAQRFQTKVSAIQQQKATLEQQALNAEAARLPEVIPEWKNAERFNSERAELAQYILGEAQKNGVNQNQLAPYLNSALAIGVARKAMLYDRLVAAKRDKSKQVRTTPPQTRASSSQPQGQPGEDSQRQLQARLRKSGDVLDAAALLANRWN